MELKTKLEGLKKFKQELYGKDFLLTTEKTLDELKYISELAETLKEFHKQGKSFKLFDSGLGISIFREHALALHLLLMQRVLVFLTLMK
jgi:hypothetical protein